MTVPSQDSTLAVPLGGDPAHHDWYLQALVKIVNGREFGFPITLYVGGLVVSGELISGHKYFEGLGDQLTEFFGGPSDETAQAVRSFTFPAGIYTEPQEGEEVPPPQYVHLRGARIFTPAQDPIPTEGVWWRGRLACVDAFHFGTLAVI
ncbi:MAG: gas vesicle accessory protein GvpU [Rhodocyclaceae bacterium]